MPLRARFFEAGGACHTDDERALLEILAEGSPYLMELLIRTPSRLAAVATDPYLRQEKPAPVMRKELLALVRECVRGRGEGARAEALSAYRDREYIRLGARELGELGSFEEVGRELAHLADTCFDAALPEVLPAPFVVFAMGKHGGEELNFSSDVDVLYVYGSDAGEGPDGRSWHELFSRLADRLTRAIGEPTQHGACFRVDLRLRPEGSRGPLVNSLAALERYYETFGRPWERQAWIKARPAAGDVALGQETLAILEPFVYPRAVGPSILDDVRSLLARAQVERAGEDNVKLGPGSIREIEFFAQALQLLHGGKNRTLRERTTLRALDKLLFAGLVSAREHQVLSEGYVFLRRVENRLQLEHGAQTHVIPAEPERSHALARRMGFASAEPFRERLEQHRRAVREIWNTLGLSDAAATVIDFAAVPFRDPEASALEIEQLSGRPHSPFAPSAGGSAKAVAPVLIEELAECPDPDQALRHLVDFAARRGPTAGVWRLLEENRALAKLLISLFGTSDFLAHRFVSRPELLEELLFLERSGPRRSQVDQAIVLDERLEGAGGDYEAMLHILRRFKQEEELRIGLHDIAGELDEGEVFEQLSALAENVLRAAFDWSEPPRVPMVILALGKLGAREIDFGSDLDLVFIHGGIELEDHERTARAAQRLIRTLTLYLEEGRLYEIDTRLRPSGRDGLLVTTLPALRAYHDGEAKLWERQALLKARVVCGDEPLADAVEAARTEIVFGRPLPEGARAQIDHLRGRMEQELASGRPGTFDFKLGRGGLIEVEFVIQFLQLMYGSDHPRIRCRATRDAIDALLADELIDIRTHGTLRGAYSFLRRLGNRMRIVHDRPGSELRTEPAGEVDKLARRMGYRGPAGEVGARLLAAYQTTTERVRALYERVLHAP